MSIMLLLPRQAAELLVSLLVVLPVLIFFDVVPVCLLLCVIDFRLGRADVLHDRQLVLHALLFGCNSGPDFIRRWPGV